MAEVRSASASPVNNNNNNTTTATAAAGDTTPEDVRKRPKTPQDFSLLKSVRYEETRDGLPPRSVASMNPPKSPSPTARSLPSSAPSSVAERSPVNMENADKGAPTPPLLPYDAKRDSGIAPSLSATPARTSWTDSHISSTAGGVAKEPALPTIVVQDDEAPAPVQRSRSASSAVKHVNNFKGIESDIPTGGFDDMDLQDLMSDKVAFSKRGSLLFGGKRMNRLLEAQGNDQAQAESVVQAPTTEKVARESPPPGGLATGRRKPSVQMVQAALQGGRVLSADEITFSMRVRSMYEHGDERAADWVSTPRKAGAAKEPNESGATNSSTPERSIDGLIVGRNRDNRKDVHPALRQPTPDSRASYYREPNELAGGIEDWEDVDARDVDRYGFIAPRRAATPSSTASPTSGEGVRRVATSLRVESDQPRRQRSIRRGPSVNTRSSRSVPPRQSGDETIRGGSMYSFQSNRSVGRLHSSNPFRSKTRKTLDEASDMLTLPPGLADIAEQEDGSRSKSSLKQREREREAKWQKMARTVPERRGPSDGKGGGMRFEFDASDQKVISRTWKGIPDRWRATAWYSFMSSSAKKRASPYTEENIIKQFHKMQDESSADDVQIDVDVPRTINMHIMFRRRYRGGQRLLFRVLHAISLFFPDVGYVQGMASLAATLLCYFDEERAFVMLVRLWELRGLQQLFQSGFEGLMAALNEFEKDWLKGGDVAQKLEELGITSTAYGTRWYLTLFNMSLPFPAQLRVWDAFMLLGDAPGDSPFGGADLDVLHATSSALIDATREILLDSDFENAMKVLTSFVPIKDEDLLMRVARTEWKLRKNRGTSKT